MKNALAYARVSTEEQAERGLSIPLSWKQLENVRILMVLGFLA